jgi:hypothetical protein
VSPPTTRNAPCLTLRHHTRIPSNSRRLEDTAGHATQGYTARWRFTARQSALGRMACSLGVRSGFLRIALNVGCPSYRLYEMAAHPLCIQEVPGGTP